jgi:hypothetical protein
MLDRWRRVSKSASTFFDKCEHQGNMVFEKYVWLIIDVSLQPNNFRHAGYYPENRLEHVDLLK